MVFIELAIALAGGLVLFCVLAWIAVSVLDANNPEVAGIVETLSGRRARAKRESDAPDA